MLRGVTTSFLVVVLCLAVLEASAAERTWTSADGVFTVKARMMRLDGDTLHLRRTDNGKEFAVKLSQLIESDQQYARMEANRPSSSSKPQGKNPFAGSLDTKDEPSAASPGETGQSPTGPSAQGTDAQSGGKSPKFAQFAPPDHRSLLEMYVASNLDVLKDSLPFQIEMFSVYHVALPKDGRDAFSQQRLFSQKYDADEFLRKKINARVAETVAKDFEKAGNLKPVRQFRLFWKQGFGEYDDRAKTFPFDHVLYDMTYHQQYMSKRTVSVPRKFFSLNKSTGRIESETLRTFSMQFGDRSTLVPSSGFRLQIEGQLPEAGLPMSPSQAEEFLGQLPRDNSGRPIRNLPIEVLVQVGPVFVDDGHLRPVPARLVAARIMHPKTGELLHRFDDELFTDSTKKTIEVAALEDDGAEESLNLKMQKLAARHGLATLNGLPVVRRKHREWKRLTNEVGREGAALARFFDLVAFGMSDQVFEEAGPLFVFNHFPREIALKYVTAPRHVLLANGWKGTDEFEQRQSKQAFLQKYGDALKKLPIELPIRLIVLSEVPFGQYDFARQGLSLQGESVSNWGSDNYSLPLPDFASLHNRIGSDPKLHKTPVLHPLFWQVDPGTAKRFEKQSQPLLPYGAYLAQTVTLDASPLTGRHESVLLPPLLATLESTTLYADENYQTRVATLDLEQSPPSVLETGLDGEKRHSGDALPLDELAIAGLMMRQAPERLGEDARKSMWRYVHRRDTQRYQLASGVVQRYAVAEQTLARLGTQFAQALTRNIEQRRQEAEQSLAYAQKHAEQVLGSSQRPFFPPGSTPLYDQELTRPQHEILEGWLKQRIESVENRFTLMAQIQFDPETREPTIRSIRDPLGNPNTAELASHLRQTGHRLDHLIWYYQLFEPDQERLSNPRYVRYFDTRKLFTELLRSNENAGANAVLLKFPGLADAMLGVIPQKLLDEALQDGNSSLQRALRIELSVDRLEFVESKQGQNSDCIVLHVLPKRLELLHKDATLFDTELDHDLLIKREKDRPLPLIPSMKQPTQDSMKLTPNAILPLIAKFQPKLLDDENSLDQLMVMRWRLENVSLFDVNPPAQRFFPRSQEMPAREERRREADRFKAWVQLWGKSQIGPLVTRFQWVRFQNGSLPNTPSPALIGGADPRRWLQRGGQFGDAVRALITNIPATDYAALLERIAIAPHDVLLERQFEIPDADGKSSYIRAYEKQSNRGVPGIPVADALTEPIIPLLRFDKEIWPSADARLAGMVQNPHLEVEFEPTKIELADQLPLHPWIEAYHQAKNSPRRAADGISGTERSGSLQVRDDGKYAVIHVRLKSAKLIDPNTGTTVLPLILREYRTVEEELPEKQAPENPEAGDQSRSGIRPSPKSKDQLALRRAGVHNPSASPRDTASGHTTDIQTMSGQRKGSLTAPNQPTSGQPNDADTSSRLAANLHSESRQTTDHPNAESSAPKEEQSNSSRVAAILILLLSVIVGGGIAAALVRARSRSTSQESAECAQSPK